MKKILGLDLGTNSIGWALIEQSFEEKTGRFIGIGSRIIPMDQASLSDFEKGNSISQTAERTRLRSARRLRERYLLRRERLHRVLNLLGFLPDHYAAQIDFGRRPGQFLAEHEPKLAYQTDKETGKNAFLFLSSYMEMLDDFRIRQPELLQNNKKVPYDWTLYYLRKKALTDKVLSEELAWILLNFNQKRGYNQLRGEDDQMPPQKLEEYFALKVVDVVDTKEKNKSQETWYNVILENGWIYHRTASEPPDWIGKTKEFIVTTELDQDNKPKKDKEGNIKRSFRMPKEDDWMLYKKKTEYDIALTGKTVGAFIYENLLENPDQKIRGKLVRTIERGFYKDELRRILEKQKEFHPELSDHVLFEKCTEELYRSNENYRKGIGAKDLVYLLINDILFYQRPLKSKKSLVDDCRFEIRHYRDKEGNIVDVPLKCIPKSHPLYQEFRLWQFLRNLKIFEKEKEVNGKFFTEYDVTNEFLKNDEDWVCLFDWLNEHKSIDQKSFLKYPPFRLNKNSVRYRWNYVEDKIYPANETRGLMLEKLSKTDGVPEGFLTKEKEMALWHILYSVTEKQEIAKALKTYAERFHLPEAFVEKFKKFPPYDNGYGSLSEKAVKKLLPLMRTGKYWNNDAIPLSARERIHSTMLRLASINNNPEKLESVADDDIPKQVLKSFLKCTDPLKGLNTYQACYAVYGRHSEEGDIKCWKSPADVESFLRYEFRQHSLRNPVVEKVITETLRVVVDIWKHYGQGSENFFDEIHIELGRDMKNPKDQRKKISEQNSLNESTNLRIKALLMEMSGDPSIENVRPYSPSQQELLRIYEEGALTAAREIPDDILTISKMSQPDISALNRYKLWLEQKYQSPYTGDFIPLGKLFTPAYEIEHVLPQSLYFDDSLNNKVICEAAVNKDKDKSTAWQYIKENEGKIIDLGFGRRTKLFSIAGYEDFVKRNYSGNRGKMKRLLMEEVPDAFIERQINDTRYITKVVKNLLSNIVRVEGEQETTSKNVLASNGKITTILKQDWGLNDVWNTIITPRFERMNLITSTNRFGEWISREGKRTFQTRVPLELQKGFSRKRIDHRHHAMDALTIACATRNHINFLNNLYAKNDEIRYDLRRQLCEKSKTDPGGGYQWIFKLPWEDFTREAKEKLSGVIVSFKQNTRLINKTTNRYQVIRRDEDGKQKKVIIRQEKGDHWAIRKSMHKDTVGGIVSLRFKKQVSLSNALNEWGSIVDRSLRSEIKHLMNSDAADKKKILKHFRDLNFQWNGKEISKVEVYYWDHDLVASRFLSELNQTFTSGKINSVTDSGIRKILSNHLFRYNEYAGDRTIEHPEIAFSADGIELLNRDITNLNNGKQHKPIYKVRTYEPRGAKFSVGSTGNKKSKYVEADKGTNLFFAIYKDEHGARFYESIPLILAIERQKQGLDPVPEVNSNGSRLLFFLSPNDLVFVPSMAAEINSKSQLLSENQSVFFTNQVYKMVSSSGSQCFFIKQEVSVPIWNKTEFSAANKTERSIDGVMIKEACVKLKVDRLGIISDIVGL